MAVAGLSPSQQQALAAMGIEQWVLRNSDDSGNAGDSGKIIQAPVDLEASQRCAELNARISACTQCDLHKSRTQAVCGVGALNSECLIIGEVPDADEDREGEPFVGRSGKLLNEMLRAIGLERRAVFISNVLKCQPPDNRDPLPEESAACLPFLEEQIQLLQPRVILVVGRIAAQTLLQNDKAIDGMRGRVYSYGDAEIPVVVTYHPAYLLRSPDQKAKSWADLLLAKDVLEGVAS